MKKWLCMQRGYTTERVQVSTYQGDIVLLSGDRVVYIPISPGYYARSGTSGGRIMVNGNRLCKNAVLMKSYGTRLTVGTTSWTAPYDGIYEVVINGAGGGAEGCIEDRYDTENDTQYSYIDGHSGYNGEQVIIKKEYAAGQYITVSVGSGGKNGETLYRSGRHGEKMNPGDNGGGTTFDGIYADGGAGGGRTNATSNGKGGSGGIKFSDPDAGFLSRAKFIEYEAENGSIHIRLLAGG